MAIAKTACEREREGKTEEASTMGNSIIGFSKWYLPKITNLERIMVRLVTLGTNDRRPLFPQVPLSQIPVGRLYLGFRTNYFLIN